MAQRSEKQTKDNDTPDEAIDFVTKMMRCIRPRPLHADVHAFREQIELYSVLPDTPSGELANNSQMPYDITYNVDKLHHLVTEYKNSSNPYALNVLMTVFENAIEFSKPIPEPMGLLVRDWVHKGLRAKRAADPLILSRDTSLVAAIMELERKWKIKPYSNSASAHENSGCHVAVRIWNEIAAERTMCGEIWPLATYDAARDAFRSDRKQRGGDSGSL